MLLLGRIVTDFNEIEMEIHTVFIQKNAFECFVWKMMVILSRPECVTFNVKEISRAITNE